MDENNINNGNKKHMIKQIIRLFTHISRLKRHSRMQINFFSEFYEMKNTT